MVQPRPLQPSPPQQIQPLQPQALRQQLLQQQQQQQQQQRPLLQQQPPLQQQPLPQQPQQQQQPRQPQLPQQPQQQQQPQPQQQPRPPQPPLLPPPQQQLHVKIYGQIQNAKRKRRLVNAILHVLQVLAPRPRQTVNRSATFARLDMNHFKMLSSLSTSRNEMGIDITFLLCAQVYLCYSYSKKDNHLRFLIYMYLGISYVI